MTDLRQDFDQAGSNSKGEHFTIPGSISVSGWLDSLDSLDSRALQLILRYTRSDGSVVFGPAVPSPRRLKQLAEIAIAIGDPSLTSVIARWVLAKTPATGGALPPLPFDCQPTSPLAILRADWSPRSDILAIDHRAPGPKSLFEIGSKKQVWLGPSWTTSSLNGKYTKPRIISWTSSAYAQSIEWSFSAGSTKVTRSLTLLRGRSMALLAQQMDGASTESELQLDLPNGVEANSLPDSQSLVLRSGPGKPSATLVPLGILNSAQTSRRGAISVESKKITIRQSSDGRRSWLPILVLWDKPARSWRPLTVAQRSKTTKGDTAVAYRVSWGRGDSGLVVYRSLGPPALRSFLGYQTMSRFLIATLTKAGEVVPILKI